MSTGPFPSTTVFIDEADEARLDAPRPIARGRPGERIGRYVVGETLGQGGMGVVVSARDPELDRDVALKLLCAAPDPRAEARLLREAQAMAQISHPNVLPVYDAGVSDGRVFIAMERVAGHTFDKWRFEGEHAMHEILAVLVQAGRGLAAAHAAGLVHRDFKPTNVMVGRDGRVRVMDFGLVLGPRVSPSTADGEVVSAPERLRSSGDLTAAGTVMGTPLYMAPEQHRGEPVDARCDQYAFAITCYEALTGKRPFGASTLKGLLAAKLTTHGELSAAVAGVPARVGAAILRGLAPDPTRRWPSMNAMLDAIAPRRGVSSRAWIVMGAAAAVLGVGLHVASRAPMPDPRCVDLEERLASVWGDQRRDRAHHGVLATGLPYAEDTWGRVEGELDRWASAWRASHREACDLVAFEARGGEARGVACLGDALHELEALVGMLEGADRAVVQQAVEAARGMPMPTTCTAQGGSVETTPNPAVAEIRAELAGIRALDRGGRIETALPQVVALVERARGMGDERVLAEALHVLGVAENHAARYEDAERDLTEAYTQAHAIGDDRTAVVCAVGLARLTGATLARFDDGMEWANHARAQLARVGDEARLRADLADAFGVIHFRAGRLDEARDALLESSRVFEAAGDELRLATSLVNLGSVRVRLEDFEGGRREYEHALAILRAELGDVHPRLVSVLMNLGNVAVETGRLEEARDHYERAIELAELDVGPDHETLAGLRNNLGVLLSDLGDDDGARASYEKAVSIWSATLGPDHPNLAGPYANLGDIEVRRGNHALALEHYRRALRIDVATFGEDAAETVGTRTQVASALLGLDDVEEGLEALRAAERIATTTQAPLRATADVHRLLVEALWRNEQHDQARLHLAKARELHAQSPSDHRGELEELEQWVVDHGVER